jgi:uncharacterized lipoprotein YbaY
VIRGTLSYREAHQLTADARSVVVLVEAGAGSSQGAIVAQTRVKGGSEPVPFELQYPWSAIRPDTSYRLYAGIADGELAWVTPIGVSVTVPAPVIEGVELPLQYRPDLLKAAVTGTITGTGLDSARDPDAYGTALIIAVNTGETVGFQLIEPTGAAPVPFSVPFEPTAITPGADYVVRGSIWDGKTLWNTDTGTPVLTNDNARSGVVMAVTAVPSPTPSPSVAPSPSFEPVPVEDTSPAGSTWLWVIIAALGAVAIIGFLATRDRGDDKPVEP